MLSLARTICCNVSSNTFYENMGFVDGKERRRILPGKPCSIVVSPKLPRESLSLGTDTYIPRLGG